MEARMARRHVTGLVILLLVLTAMPAAAGTAEDPEITDRCGDFGTQDDRRVMPDWADICAGWFETLSEREEVPELRLTLRMVDLEDRLPAVYGMWWTAGECGFSVWHVDGQLHLPEESFLVVDCSGDAPPECTVEFMALVCDPSGTRIPLPDEAVEITGTDVSWTLRFDGPLAAHADDLEHDAVVGVRGAVAGGRAGDRILVSYGCTFGSNQPTQCRSIGGDLLFGGRDYVVGT